MLPNGQMAHYDKRHLFAYADENKHYTAGDKRLIVSVKGWRINLQVCYDPVSYTHLDVYKRQGLHHLH